jgi:hypothetical protein
VCRVGACGASRTTPDISSNLLELMSAPRVLSEHDSVSGSSIVRDADRNGDRVLDLEEAAEYLVLDGKLNLMVWKYHSYIIV